MKTGKLHLTNPSFNSIKDVSDRWINSLRYQNLAPYIELTSNQSFLIDIIVFLRKEKLFIDESIVNDNLKFLLDETDEEKELKQLCRSLGYPDDDIETLLKCLLLEFSHFALYTNTYGHLPLPPQTVVFNSQDTDLPDLTLFIKKHIYKILAVNIRSLPLGEQERTIRNVLTGMYDLSYDNDSDFLRAEIEYFKGIKENLIEAPKVQSQSVIQNLYSEIFQGSDNQAFLMLQEFLSLNPIEKHKDWSFLFQHMKEDKIIHDLSYKVFITWLLDSNLITRQQYDGFMVKGSFVSLYKSKGNPYAITYKTLRDKFFPNRPFKTLTKLLIILLSLGNALPLLK